MREEGREVEREGWRGEDERDGTREVCIYSNTVCITSYKVMDTVVRTQTYSHTTSYMYTCIFFKA